MLLIEQKSLFLNVIAELRQKLRVLKVVSTLEELELFENQLTLDELENCFLSAPLESCPTQLSELLAQRWERIRGSNMCYTRKPFNEVNQLCLNLAMALSPSIETTLAIEALKPNTGPYFLLMPSLEKSEDVYGENIHHLQLHEFVLSDKERVHIPLLSCLHQASISDEGRLRHMVAIDDENPELTPSEIERVSTHSSVANGLYQYILALNKQRILGDDIGAKLNQLAVALRKGGSRNRGTELNAGAAANVGIFSFYEYWTQLSSQQKTSILAETPSLGDILNRLFRAEQVNYRETRFCVELIANYLDPIIEIYRKRPNIQALQQEVFVQEEKLKSALGRPQELIIAQNLIPPKHILYLIYKLSADEQKKIFKTYGCENALIFALMRAPEALIEFELDEKTKQQAASMRLTLEHQSGLIIAAKRGEIDAIRLLIHWGSDIKFQDWSGNTALHWAANNGHLDAVNCLLECGALLEARESMHNTALNLAVKRGQRDVVERLLAKNANINARNAWGQNALDLAHTFHPDLMESILLQIALLPVNEQEKCLNRIPGSPYPNVLFYAAEKNPALFDALVIKILHQPNQALIRAVFDTRDAKGYNAIILAAQIGAHESIAKLLAFGLAIESHDLKNRTALHWAAWNGHMEAVNCLLNHGALLEAKDYKFNTPLNLAAYQGHKNILKRLLESNADVNMAADDNRTPLIHAVKQGHKEVVELLLDNQANITIRSHLEEANALDIAMDFHPHLVEPLLKQVIILPVSEQKECLRKLPGCHPNVLFYAAITDIKLLDNLLRSFNNKYLDSNMQPILTQLHQMGLHYRKMQKKSASNENYQLATSTAATLLETCTEGLLEIYQNSDHIATNMLEFKTNCQKAIKEARPVLAQHREWGKMIAKLMLAILALPISLPIYALGFFSVKTRSAQLLDNLQVGLNKLQRCP